LKNSIKITENSVEIVRKNSEKRYFYYRYLEREININKIYLFAIFLKKIGKNSLGKNSIKITENSGKIVEK